MIIIEQLIPYYSLKDNEKVFYFYRVPTSKAIKLAKSLEVKKLTLNTEANGCEYRGINHIHKINFELKSCTCRWFLAFAMCSHLISSCDHYNIVLNGYSKQKTFVIELGEVVRKNLSLLQQQLLIWICL